jgi:hypothetical protein
MNKSAFRGRLGVRPDYPTLRKEREGWGTRQLVEGIEPKGAFLLPSTCYRQASLLKSETWATHSKLEVAAFILTERSAVEGSLDPR